MGDNELVVMSADEVAAGLAHSRGVDSAVTYVRAGRSAADLSPGWDPWDHKYDPYPWERGREMPTDEDRRRLAAAEAKRARRNQRRKAEVTRG